MADIKQMQAQMFMAIPLFKAAQKANKVELSESPFKKVLDSKFKASKEQPENFGRPEKAEAPQISKTKDNDKREAYSTKNASGEGAKAVLDKKKVSYLKDEGIKSKPKLERKHLDSAIQLMLFLHQLFAKGDFPEELIEKMQKSFKELSSANLSELEPILKEADVLIQKIDALPAKIEETLKQFAANLLKENTNGNQSPISEFQNIQTKQDLKRLFKQLQKQVQILAEKIQAQKTDNSESRAGTLESLSTADLLQTGKKEIKDEFLKQKQVQQEENPKRKIFKGLEKEGNILREKLSILEKDYLPGKENQNRESFIFKNVAFQIDSQQVPDKIISTTAQPLAANMQIKAEDIIQQIVSRADLSVDEDKSEIIIHLKPESLGKLSLKVIHERGQIMARFVAESDQVKAILESNMQILKDSLEKQGLSVHGFSVSVGQDSDQNRQMHSSFYKGKKTGRLTLEEAVETIRAENSFGTVPAGYIYQDVSSINLTA